MLLTTLVASTIVSIAGPEKMLDRGGYWMAPGSDVQELRDVGPVLGFPHFPFEYNFNTLGKKLSQFSTDSFSAIRGK